MAEYLDNIRFLLKLSRLAPGLRTADLAERLAAISADLGNLARETEGEILTLGTRLEEFSKVAGGVSRRGSEIVERIRASEQLTKAQEVFSSASGRLGDCNREIVSGLSRLGAISQRLDNLFRLHRSLNHLTRTVRMLRVATRMETVRLKEEEEGDLNMLADEIDGFSQRMDTHVAGFFERADEVAQGTARLTAGMDTERRGYKEHLDEAGRATGQALEQIGSILTRAADLSEATSRRTRDVVSEVGQIVSSLQFHDITRQQIEHVQKALREAVDRLRRAAGERGRWAERGLATEVHRILDLQRAQLGQVKTEIEFSGQRISDSLSGIGESCQAQANDLTPLLGQDAEKRGLNRLEEQMAVLAQILEEGSRLSRNMFDSTRAAVALLDKMEGALLGIQSINEELNLLALNALVKVSRHGEGGRALAEVAEAVNRLSLEPREIVNQAADEVKALLEEARELGTVHEAALKENQQQAESVANEAAAALRGLRELGREVSQAVVSLAADSEVLVYDLKGVAGAVSFHRLVSGRVDAALAVLDQCCRELEAAGAHKAHARGQVKDRTKSRISAVAGRLLALEQHYTMESERQVHRATFEQRGPERPAADRPREGEPGAAEGEEFGDNVELF